MSYISFSSYASPQHLWLKTITQLLSLIPHELKKESQSLP